MGEALTITPSGNGHDGRASDGKFKHGNRLGRGNPLMKATAKLRHRLLRCITADDVEKAVQTLRDVMEQGTHFERIAAARELLNRAVGKPIARLDSEIMVTSIKKDANSFSFTQFFQQLQEMRQIQQQREAGQDEIPLLPPPGDG